MAEYQLTSNKPNTTVIRTADRAFIPPDPANRDWVTYQEWLVAGNVPDAAPPPPPEPTPPPPVALSWSDQYDASAQIMTFASAEGYVVFDNADPALATRVSISAKKKGGTDVSSPFLVAAQPGRVLRLEQRINAACFISYDIIATSKQGDSIAIDVAFRNEATFGLVDNMPLNVAVYIPGGGPAASITSRRFP